jgi:hypothetical protein
MCKRCEFPVQITAVIVELSLAQPALAVQDYEGNGRLRFWDVPISSPAGHPYAGKWWPAGDPLDPACPLKARVPKGGSYGNNPAGKGSTTDCLRRSHK